VYRFQEVFARKAKANKQDKTKSMFATTHLITCVTNNEKYEAAQKWNVTVVEADWILQCYSKGQRVAPEPYHPRKLNVSDSSGLSYLPSTPTQNLRFHNAKRHGLPAAAESTLEKTDDGQMDFMSQPSQEQKEEEEETSSRLPACHWLRLRI